MSKLPRFIPNGFKSYFDLIPKENKDDAWKLFHSWELEDDPNIMELTGGVAADSYAFGVKTTLEFLGKSNFLAIHGEPPDPRKFGWKLVFEYLEEAMIPMKMNQKQLADLIHYGHDTVRQKKSAYKDEFGEA